MLSCEVPCPGFWPLISYCHQAFTREVQIQSSLILRARARITCMQSFCYPQGFMSGKNILMFMIIHERKFDHPALVQVRHRRTHTAGRVRGFGFD